MANKKNKAHYHGHRRRLMKRVKKSLSYIEEYELLESLLTFAQPRKDVKGQAKGILYDVESIRNMVLHTHDSYQHIDGIGESLSWYCCFLAEIAKRYATLYPISTTTACTQIQHNDEDQGKIPSFTFSQVKEYLEKQSIATCEEGEYILYVNKEKSIIAMEACTFSEDNVLFITHIIQKRPVGIILVKKVNNKTYTLCKEDIEILQRKEKALFMFSITLLDYIICTPKSIVSLQQYSLLGR